MLRIVESIDIEEVFPKNVVDLGILFNNSTVESYIARMNSMKESNMILRLEYFANSTETSLSMSIIIVNSSLNLTVTIDGKRKVSDVSLDLSMHYIPLILLYNSSGSFATPSENMSISIWGFFVYMRLTYCEECRPPHLCGHCIERHQYIIADRCFNIIAVYAYMVMVVI